MKTHASTMPNLVPTKRDYTRNPLLVYWEMTQACALACKHCRAAAILQCHPRQLTTEESRALLQQITAFGDPMPHLILTSGDPLQRTDLYELIDYARALGLQVSITPSATEALTHDVLKKLKAHGIQSLGLSLDGSNAQRHEAVRGVEGCFDWTMRAAHTAAEVGLPIQINTLVSQETVDDLPAIYETLMQIQVMRWSLFFLISVGRGRVLQPLDPIAAEDLMRWLLNLLMMALVATVVWWLVQNSYRITGFDIEEVKQRLATLTEDNRLLKRDLDAAKGAVVERDRQLQIERAAQGELARTVAQLQEENAALKEDLGFLRNIMSSGATPEGIGVANLKIERDGKPNEYRYRMLLTQGGQRKQDFRGKVQVLARVVKDGANSTMTFPDAPATDPAGAFEFRFYHKVEGRFAIPEGATLKSVDVRVLALPGGQVKLSRTINQL